MRARDATVDTSHTPARVIGLQAPKLPARLFALLFKQVARMERPIRHGRMWEDGLAIEPFPLLLFLAARGLGIAPGLKVVGHVLLEREAQVDDAA